ncbi:hypothetical protein F4777DRAFT_467784 [Nemania sp. FL0916]|nr:hypothetical protein F4777DRAFT_467784 [Nemania sp. FL0916]
MIGSHRDNAHFSRAGWRKRILLPCWIIQIALLLSLMGLFSYRLSHTVTAWEDQINKGDVPVVEFVWEIANIGFSLVSLVVTLVSIARFIAEVLTPLPLLFGCILNGVLSLVVLALDIVIYVQRKDKNYSSIGLGLDAALIFFTIIPLLYAIFTYRRLLSYDDYHLPGNHKAFGFPPVVEETVDDRWSAHLLSPPVPYDPTSPGLGVTTTITGGESASATTRGRSVSIGSHRISLSLTRPLSISPHPSPSPPNDTAVVQERRVSYDHKRDTQFELYAARRKSQRSSHSHRRDGSNVSNISNSGSGYFDHEDVHRAMEDEFGFSDLPTPVLLHDTPAPSRAGSVKVTSNMKRKTSYEATLVSVGSNSSSSLLSPPVVVTTPPTGSSGGNSSDSSLRRGLSLNLRSVPEAGEDDADDNVPRSSSRIRVPERVGRRRAVSESHQALLGDRVDALGVSGSGSGRVGVRRIGERAAATGGFEDVELELQNIRKRARDS